LVEYGRKPAIIRIAAFLTLLKLYFMWNSFRLILVEPAMIQRAGKLQEALEIATKVEDQISFNDGSYLEMSVQETTSSAHVRLNGFYFPILISVTRLTGEVNKKLLPKPAWPFGKEMMGVAL
jgi:hypothetical protein